MPKDKFEVNVSKTDGSCYISKFKFDTFDEAVTHGNELAKSALVLAFHVQEVKQDEQNETGEQATGV